MGQAISAIKEYTTVAFVLLGVLFGMMIMTFIFGNLGNANINTIADTTTTITNRSAVYINTTGYTIPEVTNSNFNGGVSVLTIYNASNGVVLLSGNYSMTSTGLLTNASATNWPSVNMTYSYSTKTDARLSTETVQNNSLQGIVAYTSNSSTQFNTVSIAIILVLLIGVFLIFWKIFVSNKKKNSNKLEGNFA